MSRFQVGPLIVDVARQEIRDNGQILQTSPLTVSLLAALVEAAPDIARHDDLMDELWPGRFVGDANLKQRVYQLRRLLEPYDVDVETVRGWGYRLAPVPAPLSEDNSDLRSKAAAAIDRLEFGKARSLYEQIVEAEPDDARSRVALAWAYVWQGKMTAAENQVALALALRSSTDDAGLRHQIDAIAASFAGDVHGAIDAYELASSLGDPPRWTLINLAGCYLLVGRIDEATEIYRRMQRADPDDPRPYWDEGVTALLVNGDVDTAERCVGEALRKGMRPPIELYDAIPAIRTWCDSGPAEALELYERAIGARIPALAPNARVHALLMRSRLHASIGDLEQAIRDLRMARRATTADSSWSGYVDLERALLNDDRELLRSIASTATPLSRAKALGWLAVAGPDTADPYLAELTEVEAPGPPEWGYSSTVALRQAQTCFPLLVEGERALDAGKPEFAAASFRRVTLMAPSGIHGTVPVVALGPRVHVVARSGLARCGSIEDDNWIENHPVQVEINAQAGAPIIRSTRQRRRQPEGTTSATPMPRLNRLLPPE